jgi:hypothetical protein
MDKMLTRFSLFRRMDVYSYCRVGQDSLLTTDELHRWGFPLLLWDVLQCFSYVEKPDYYSRGFCEFQIGHCEVRVDILLNAKQSSWMAWSTSATGHDMSDTLEMVAHQALTMFCEQHLTDTADTPIALFPIRNPDDRTWQRHMKAACDETRPTFHAGYLMSTRYAQNMCNLLQEVERVNTFQRRDLKEYGQQNAKLKKATCEMTKGVKLLRQNASDWARERRDYECLLRGSEAGNDRLRALVETTREDEEYAKKYSQFLEKELAKRDGELLGKDARIRARDIELGNKDIEIAQRLAQIVQLGITLHQLQKHVHVWLPPPEDLEEDPEDIQGMSDVDDVYLASRGETTKETAEFLMILGMW